MGRDFLETLEGAKSPYYGRATLGAERGDLIDAETSEHPPLEVIDSKVMEAKAIYIQVLKLRHTGTGDDAYLRRCVADVGDGVEMDISDPIAMDATLAESGVDVSTCAACCLKIHADDLVNGSAVIEGRYAYHAHCLG